MVPFFIQRGGGGDNEDLAREQISKVLGENARLCVSKHPSINTVSVFEELCTLVWGYPGESSEGAAKSLFSEQKPKFQNSDLADVLKATVQLRWYPWFEKIAAAHEGSLPTSFFGWVPETFHKATLKIEKWFGPLEKGYVWYHEKQASVLTSVGYLPRCSHTLEPNSRSGRWRLCFPSSWQTRAD